MDDRVRLTGLWEWLEETGRSKTWLASTIGYSYQQTHAKLSGRSPLNDDFVLRCFKKVSGLPKDVFAEQGYVKEGDAVRKMIPLPDEE